RAPATLAAPGSRGAGACRATVNKNMGGIAMTFTRDILIRSAWAALAALCLVALDARDVAAQAVMKIGSATINDTQHHWMNLLQEAMARRAGSRLKVEVYPASQLGSIP